MDKENLYTHTDTYNTVECFSTIKKNENLPFAAVVLGRYYAKWKKSEKDKYCMISLNCGI